MMYDLYSIRWGQRRVYLGFKNLFYLMAAINRRKRHAKLQGQQATWKLQVGNQTSTKKGSLWIERTTTEILDRAGLKSYTDKGKPVYQVLTRLSVKAVTANHLLTAEYLKDKRKVAIMSIWWLRRQWTPMHLMWPRSFYIIGGISTPSPRVTYVEHRAMSPLITENGSMRTVLKMHDPQWDLDTLVAWAWS